jgi:hypothetical protein
LVFAAHFAAWKTRAFDHAHLDPGAGEPERRGASRRAAADDDDVEVVQRPNPPGTPRSVSDMRKNASRRAAGTLQPAAAANRSTSRGV